MKRRKVFYISGFDPKGPAGYHDLYVEQAQRQSALSGMHIDVGRRRKAGDHVAQWQVHAIEDGHAVETDYCFLRWDDVIRNEWPRGAWRVFGLMAGVYLRYIRSGVLRRVLANSWPTFIAGSYPIAAMVLCLVGLWLAGFVLAAVLCAAAGWPIWVAAVIAVPFAVGLYPPVAQWVDDRLQMHWVSRIYVFSLKQSARSVDAYEDRVRQMTAIVAAAADEADLDEILVVGHSTGAQTAVSVVAGALQQNPQLGHSSRLALLTLGGSIPMLSWQPDAGWFREHLQQVAHCPHLDWLDFSAAQDGASFPLHDPVISTGISHADPDHPKPKLLSIQLMNLYERERFLQIRRKYGLVHFHYLMAGEKLADYDYFAITAGCRFMADRYAHRPAVREFDRFRTSWLGD